MTAEQENILSSYRTLTAVCEKYKTIWTGLAGFANNYTKFAATIQDIEDTAREQAERSGAAAEKAARRARLVELTLIVAGAVSSCARDRDDADTIAKVAYSRTDLLGGRDSRTAERCEIVLSTAQRLGAALGDYLENCAAQLLTLKNAATAYRQSLAKPGEVRAALKRLTARLAGLFATADDLLVGHLDRLTPQFGTRAPQFVGEYLAARTIVNNAGPSAAPDAPTPRAA
jgi:hypothetical protein